MDAFVISSQIDFEQGFGFGKRKSGLFAQSRELGFSRFTLQSHRPPRIESLCQFLTA